MTQIEQIALDYLWPYREQWVCPADIKQLPPDVFQGWNVEIKGEVLTLSQGQETHIFSLKKLIVQIDKERGGMFGQSPATPRELAKLLIHTSVKRKENLEHLAYSHQGMGWYGYGVSIGGYIQQPGKKKPVLVDCWHILVDEFEGEACAHVFDLKEIYHEIEVDLQRGYALVQPTLF
jgi:hypothetical protein